MSHFSANDRRKMDYSYTGLVSRHTLQGGTIIPKRYVWVGDADFSTGVGLVNGVDGKKGLLGTYHGTTTIDISATNGNFQLGPDGKNVKYDGTNLTITGSNLVLSSGNYVWVGTPTTDGVGFTSDGLYAAISGVNTVEISQTDGSFTFGKTSGSYLAYDPSSGGMTFHGPIASDVYNAYVTAATLGVYTTTETDGLLDGKINCYYQTSAPSSGMDSNDFWIDTDDDNKVYVYNGSSWEAVSNQDAVQALADAATAQDTADGKRTVFVATPTTPYDLGDLWKHDADTLYVCDTARASGAYVAGDWELVATNGATTGTNMYSSGGSILGDAHVITAYGGVGAYRGDPFPITNGNPQILNMILNNSSTGNGWYKIAVIPMDSYGGVTFDGLVNWGTNAGRSNYQARVKFSLTCDSSGDITATRYRYSGDDVSSHLYLRYSGSPSTAIIYLYTVAHRSFGMNGTWNVHTAETTQFWSQLVYTDSLGTSDPGGTNVTATANYELEATVGATAGTNLYRGSGSTLYDADVITSQGTASDVEYGSGKAVYQAHADRTSYNTAYNTSRVNGAETDSGYTYDVLGDLRIMNGKDIEFYTGDGTGYVGGISANTKGVFIHGASNDVYIEGEDITLYPGSGYNIYLRGDSICYGAMRPQTTTLSETLGTSSTPWYELYADRLGDAANYIGTSYLTTAYISTAYVTALSVSTSATLPVNLTCGSATHDSSHNFKLYYWHTGDSQYYALDCYTSNW